MVTLREMGGDCLVISMRLETNVNLFNYYKKTIINRCFNITGHFPFWYLSLIAFSKKEQNYMHKILGGSGLVLACNSKNVLTFEPFRM